MAFPHVCTVRVTPNAAAEGVTSYNFYLDGVLVGTCAASSAPSAPVTFSLEGVYTIGVSAVNVVGEGSQTQVQVAAVDATPTALLVLIP